MSNIDLEKLTENLLEDLQEFKYEGVDKEVAMMHIYRAFSLGRETATSVAEAWWETMDQDAQYQAEQEHKDELSKSEMYIETYNFYR